MNRRTFLKSLMAAAGVAAFGVPAVAETVPDPAIWDEAIPDAVPDLPITPQNPFCWIEIDGQKFGLVDAQIDVTNLWDDRGIFAGRSWEIDCKGYYSQALHAALDEMFCAGKECALTCGRYRFRATVMVSSIELHVDSPYVPAPLNFRLSGMGDLRLI